MALAHRGLRVFQTCPALLRLNEAVRGSISPSHIDALRVLALQLASARNRITFGSNLQ
jgi:hypothetical protein